VDFGKVQHISALICAASGIGRRNMHCVLLLFKLLLAGGNGGFEGVP
jgi:hypothetical protein